MWVIITATNKELKEYEYQPLKSGGIYKAKWTEGGGGVYYDVFIDDDEFVSAVWEGRLRRVELEELRELKLKKLGI